MAKKREALDPKYQWDLNSLYPSDEAWEKISKNYQRPYQNSNPLRDMF